MPQEVIVSASLKVGGLPMIGTIKHFVGRREHRTSAPITLLSATQLRIGDNDVRQIICAATESGQTSYLVNSVTVTHLCLNRRTGLIKLPKLSKRHAHPLDFQIGDGVRILTGQFRGFDAAAFSSHY